MKVKIFGKRKNDRLNEDRLDELQKRLEKFIPTHDNVSDKIVTSADIMKDYAKRAYMLCVFESIKEGNEIDAKARESIVKSCALCLFGMSVLMSELGVPISSVVKELERKIQDEEKWRP
nr:MAG TPA: hypothetical protein [Caudoviricetes sp.]